MSPTERRVALVTGGARRLGAEIVRAFAARDYDVMIHHGHSAADAAALTAELRTAGGRAETVEADLRDTAAPQAIVDATMRAYGRLDVVISSASVMDRVAFDRVSAADWDRAADVNLRAPFFLMQSAARVMPDGGAIVQLSDHLAFEAIFPHLIPHQVTKAALTSLVATVAGALAPRIRVNAVAPGLVLAPAELTPDAVDRFLRDVPLARSGSPSDVVQAILFLVDAAYVNGIVLPVDGGRHLWR